MATRADRLAGRIRQRPARGRASTDCGTVGTLHDDLAGIKEQLHATIEARAALAAVPAATVPGGGVFTSSVAEPVRELLKLTCDK